MCDACFERDPSRQQGLGAQRPLTTRFALRRSLFIDRIQCAPAPRVVPSRLLTPDGRGRHESHRAEGNLACLLLLPNPMDRKGSMLAALWIAWPCCYLLIIK